MSYYFSCFFVYSFFGCGLETLFALVNLGELVSRKTLLLFPLCPVYGLGALAIIWSTKKFADKGWKVFFVGMVAATTVELFMDIVYRDLLGVQIWDYSNQPFNLGGRICLPFSIAWGFLSLILVKYIHPKVHQMIENVPKKVNAPVAMITVFDIIISCTLLALYGDKAVLESVFTPFLYMK